MFFGLGVTTEVGAELLEELEGARAQVERLTAGNAALYQAYEPLLWNVRFAISRAREYLIDSPTRLKDIESFDREARAAHAKYFPQLEQAFATITGRPAVRITSTETTTAGNLLDDIALALKTGPKKPEPQSEEGEWFPSAKPIKEWISYAVSTPQAPAEPDTYTESMRNQPDPSAKLTTPTAGTKKQPILSPSDVGKLIQSVFGSWTSTERAKLQSSLIARQVAGQNIYLPPKQEQQFAKSKLSFANVASVAVATLVVGGLLVGVYLFYKGQNKG